MSLSKLKKRKVEKENRNFQEKWQNKYFVIEARDKVQCLICLETVAVRKEYNIKRHYETKHKKQYDVFSGKMREEKITQLKSALSKQQNVFSKLNETSKNAVRASFALSEKIAQSSRPFTEGTFIKECLLTASDILCPEKKKLFESISLSANTVASRITELASNSYQKLTAAAKNFETFSFALDESTGVTDVSYCAVFIRGVDKDFNITEELLDLLPLKGSCTGQNVFNELEMCIERAGLDWSKLVAVATDGAPAMCSERVGLVGLLKDKVKKLGEYISAIHCIIHQEALCGKKIQMKNVMDVVVKTVNFIRARSLNHRQFTSFLSSMESEYGELLYHTEVRWLTRGNVLRRFFALREEIGLFMAMKKNDIPELCNPTFISNLAFLTDLTDHLNMLNRSLQGPKQVITIMYDCVKAFKCKLLLWRKQLENGNFAHFKTLQSLGKVDAECLTEYVEMIANLHTEFERRFQDFQALEKQFVLFATPLVVDVETVREDLQMELMELQCDTLLRQKYAEVGIPEFYKFLPFDKFPKLCAFALRILAMFGSTYVCEQFFSTMKVNKSAIRSRLTDEHLQSVLRLATIKDASLKPDIDSLVNSKRIQKSSI